MKTAKLDGQPITASQTIILLFFNTISANHVKIHSLANWSVNVEPEQEINDPFHARNSLITIMYNYMGYSGFTQLFPFWKSLGLLDICCEKALVILQGDPNQNLKFVLAITPQICVWEVYIYRTFVICSRPLIVPAILKLLK